MSTLLNTLTVGDVVVLADDAALDLCGQQAKVVKKYAKKVGLKMLSGPKRGRVVRLLPSMLIGLPEEVVEPPTKPEEPIFVIWTNGHGQTRVSKFADKGQVAIFAEKYLVTYEWVDLTRGVAGNCRFDLGPRQACIVQGNAMVPNLKISF